MVSGWSAHLGDDIGVVGVDAGVVKADGGCLDGAAVQLDGTKVEGDAGVGLCVLQRVQPRAVAGAVKDIVALDGPVQNQAGLAPAYPPMRLLIRMLSSLSSSCSMVICLTT